MTIALLGLIARHYIEPQRWVGIAKKLRYFLILPTGIIFIVVWILGIWMAVLAGWYEFIWFWLKIAILMAVSGVHGRVSKSYRLPDQASGSVLSDVVWLLAFVGMIAATVFLVLAKPF